MSETTVDETNDDEPTPEQPTQAFSSRKQAQAEAQAQAAENERLKRENAMLRAGVPTGTKLGAFFAENYKGALDDESIMTAANELGVFGGAKADEGLAQAEADDKALAQARKGLVGSATQPSDPGPGPDPGIVGLERFREERAKNVSREIAAGATINTIIAAGVKGDPRVVHTGWTPEQLAQRPGLTEE